MRILQEATPDSVEEFTTEHDTGVCNQIIAEHDGVKFRLANCYDCGEHMLLEEKTLQSMMDAVVDGHPINNPQFGLRKVNRENFDVLCWRCRDGKKE